MNDLTYMCDGCFKGNLQIDQLEGVEEFNWDDNKTWFRWLCRDCVELSEGVLVS